MFVREGSIIAACGSGAIRLLPSAVCCHEELLKASVTGEPCYPVRAAVMKLTDARIDTMSNQT
jgi:hypothetical protein